MKGKEYSKDREFAVVLEGIRSDFKIFGEGLSEVRAEVSTVKKRLDMLYEEFGKQKQEIFFIKADIRVIKTDVAVLKTDVAVLKTDVAVLKTDVAEIKDTLKGHTNRLAHLEAAR